MTNDPYIAIFETLELDATLTIDETIVPDTLPESVFGLPRIPLKDASDEAPFVVEDTLGVGGMGQVMLASQTALGRAVAIKTVKGRAGDETARRLLHEARAMSMLEHPNIVPIYAIGEDEEGRPVIVMKRVEGETWTDATPTGDPMEWNLRVLLEVCDALAFAHSRGVIHRDIKRDNIMIGPFGEVYLMDWGIAVALGDGDGLSIPAASDSNSVAGTPAYMAPEMTLADGSLLGVHTDIYLLGALLSELITGEAPHSGESLFEVMVSAYHSNPVEFEVAVDPLLANICHRAMAADAKARYTSAAAFRAAISDYLSHRSSRVVAHQSHEALNTLLDALKGDPEDDIIHREFGAARFGFERALEVWPSNAEAREGLQRTLEAVARWELKRGNPAAAARLVRELPEPNPLLESQVDQLQSNRAAEGQELDDLRVFRGGLDASVDIALKRRISISTAIATLILFAPFSVAHYLGYTYSPAMHLFGAVLVAIPSLTLRFLARPMLDKTPLNARLVQILYGVGGAAIMARCLTAYSGDVMLGLAMEVLVLGAGSVALGFSVDGRFRWSGIICLVGAVIMVMLGPLAIYVYPFVLAAGWLVVGVAKVELES